MHNSENGEKPALVSFIPSCSFVWQTKQLGIKTDGHFCRNGIQKNGANWIRPCSNQHETFFELYEMHSETKSVVSVDEKLEKNDYHQYTVEFYRYFSQVGSNG